MATRSIGDAIWEASREEVASAIARGDYTTAISMIDNMEQIARLNRESIPKSAHIYSGMAHILQMAATAEVEGRRADADLISRVMAEAAERVGADYR
ncbi:TPA: hypothetical protein HA265_00055 [Candidatus Woesearchaeota archaeon]|nr:hypothetical protein [Candidatus Woesearchaeota archaeon]